MKTRITRIAAALLLTTYCLLPTFSFAQPGSLDLSFGTGGIVTTDFGSDYDWAYSVAIQTDGKLVVAGTSLGDFALTRYNTDGTLDLGFGTGGKVTTDLGSSGERGHSVAIQTDGKIVVAGYSGNGPNWDFALVRYTTNGALDLTFGTGGKVTTPIGIARSVAIQTDGKIVVAGSSSNGTNWDFALVRYTTNGSLDLGFGTGGVVTTNIGSGNDKAYSVVLQTDGKLVVAGFSKNGTNDDFALVRYITNGSLDNTFGTGGIVTTNYGSSSDEMRNSLAIQTDGKLVVAGNSNNSGSYDFALVRYTTNGALDLTFGTGGIVTTDIFGSSFDSGNSVAIQTDGKLVVAGRSRNNGGNDDFAVVRYNGEGVTSIAENTMEADFTVYPNPNNGIFTIALDATLQFANYTLRIMNTLGQEVYQSAIATPQTTIDMSTLSKGIYLLSLFDGEQEAHRKIVKE